LFADLADSFYFCGMMYSFVPFFPPLSSTRRPFRSVRWMLTVLSLLLPDLCTGRTIEELETASLYTHPISTDIKTLRCLVDEDFQRLPVIDMEGRSRMEWSFDLLADYEARLSYRLVHCTADWQLSNLSELDFIDGFQPTRITDVTPSFNTNVPYYHYRITYPNDDLSLLCSGNYALLVFADDDPDQILAIATFSLNEATVSVGGTVSAQTDIDFRREHQQLTLSVQWQMNTFPHLDPAAELILKVQQNHRRDTERTVLHPSRTSATTAYYEHEPKLIFPAGNTFRRFELTEVHYAPIGVAQIDYHAPYYYAWLTPGKSRQGTHYLYDRDQHGRYYIHALRVDDPDTEGDYFVAGFSLLPPLPPTGSQAIYLYGDFTYGVRCEATEMRYNAETGSYQQQMLLKQGAYNYLYLVGTEHDDPLRTSPIEGDYYETENEYSVAVYYRTPGARYDRLVGFATF
jgi:hypothetical protein